MANSIVRPSRRLEELEDVISAGAAPGEALLKAAGSGYEFGPVAGGHSSHAIGDVTGLTAALEDKAELPIAQADVTGLTAALAALSAALEDKAELPIAQADVTGLTAALAGLQAAIDGKASLPIAQADVTGLTAALAALTAEIEGKEPALGAPDSDGKLLASTAGGARSWVAAPTGGGGVTDHGALTGLGDNDHPQYALLAAEQTFTAAQWVREAVGSGSGLLLNPFAASIYFLKAGVAGSGISVAYDATLASEAITMDAGLVVAGRIRSGGYFSAPGLMSGPSSWPATAAQGEVLMLAASGQNARIYMEGDGGSVSLTTVATNALGISGSLAIGHAAAPASRLDIADGAMRLAEMSAPSAPAANSVVLYAKDNGAGKTQLMARFPTGAEQQVAIEP